jgi:hypothetical protein
VTELQRYLAEEIAEDHADGRATVQTVSVSTPGLLAETQLGSCDACEWRDVTRFWKWDESP